MRCITGPLQQSCQPYPLSQPSQPHFAPTQRYAKSNKESNTQEAVGKAHKISMVAGALFAPYLLGGERKRSIV